MEFSPLLNPSSIRYTFIRTFIRISRVRFYYPFTRAIIRHVETKYGRERGLSTMWLVHGDGHGSHVADCETRFRRIQRRYRSRNARSKAWTRSDPTPARHRVGLNSSIGVNGNPVSRNRSGGCTQPLGACSSSTMAAMGEKIERSMLERLHARGNVEHRQGD